MYIVWRISKVLKGPATFTLYLSFHHHKKCEDLLFIWKTSYVNKLNALDP